ncbi:MAG: hypothetical protein JKY95_09870, partial [Planctomycetaceae bacterium]|nr:hypothetical protein [Planctomycetaceae bacterium]
MLLFVCSSNLYAQDVSSELKKCEPKVCQQNIKRHIETLASVQMQGRRGVNAIKAAKYVAGEFQKLNLLRVFPKSDNQVSPSYFQNIPGRPNQQGVATVAGQNVAAMLVGCDEKLEDEYIIV